MYKALRQKNETLRERNEAMQRTVSTQEHDLRETQLRVVELERVMCTLQQQYATAVEHSQTLEKENAALVRRNTQLWKAALGDFTS